MFGKLRIFYNIMVTLLLYLTIGGTSLKERVCYLYLLLKCPLLPKCRDDGRVKCSRYCTDVPGVLQELTKPKHRCHMWHFNFRICLPEKGTEAMTRLLPKVVFLKFRRKVVYTCLLLSVSCMWLYLSPALQKSAFNGNTSNDNNTRQYRMRRGTILVDVTQFGHSLKQVEEQSVVRKKGLVLHGLSVCFQNRTCGKGEDRGMCSRRASFRNTYECQHLMGLGNRNMGRTGNQMFQVAALLGIACYHGYTAILDKSMSMAAWFDLPNLSRVRFARVSHFNEKACCKFDRRVNNLSHATNWTLGGYFQSWRYFKGSEEIVKRAFKLKKDFTEQAREFINATVSNDTKTVGIHVRRGDFVSTSQDRRGYKTAPLDYIQRAVDYFRIKHELVHFFVVSDDKAWCRHNLKWPNVTVSPFLTVGQDMALMVESDAVIVTSGSFGWWGAWLSGGEAVYWTGYPGNTTWLGKLTNYSDYYPDRWIGLS